MATFANGAADPFVSGKCGDDSAWVFRTDAGAEKSCNGADVDPFSWRIGIGVVVRGEFLLPCVSVSIAAKCRPKDVSASV